MDVAIKLGQNELRIETEQGEDTSKVEQLIKDFFDQAGQHAKGPSQTQPQTPGGQQQPGQQPGQHAGTGSQTAGGSQHDPSQTGSSSSSSSSGSSKPQRY